jgi:hypothetical protein
MDFIARSREGRRSIAKGAVENGVFREFRPGVVDFIVVIWIAEMDFIRTDSDYGAWRCR